MRRIPWRWIVIGTVAFGAIVGGYTLKEKQKADALRAQILNVHEQKLSAESERYVALRDKLEKWVVRAASTRPERFADPELKIPGLRARKGMYLRLRFNDAVSKENIGRAARTARADAIVQCLGLEPAWARDLYEKGEFLLPDWKNIVEARHTDNVMRLRVIDDELALFIRRDLPVVNKMLDPDWFMLVLQQGKARRDALVDVFLWDIHTGKSLLRARIQGKGLLVPFRFVTKDGPAAPKLPFNKLQGAAASDCSIAAQIKTLTGSPLTTFDSKFLPPPADAADNSAKPEDAGEPETEQPGAPPDAPKSSEEQPEAPKTIETPLPPTGA